MNAHGSDDYGFACLTANSEGAFGSDEFGYPVSADIGWPQGQEEYVTGMDLDVMESRKRRKSPERKENKTIWNLSLWFKETLGEPPCIRKESAAVFRLVFQKIDYDT